MRRNEVWWVDFPTAGSGEIHKTRPSIIVSNDSANANLNRVQVVPLTTNVKKLYPSEAYVLVKGKKHKALADQITTVGKTRLKNKFGQVSAAEMRDVENAIRVQLALP
ncbi:MAG: type II toxin-antitoxin system PemK/MazF family toxin [Planctomycetia bacterium]|nr:type II toxin-antitoxin system PemK/MazF family toxin [Planctomycetia bacterium]